MSRHLKFWSIVMTVAGLIAIIYSLAPKPGGVRAALLASQMKIRPAERAALGPDLSLETNQTSVVKPAPSPRMQNALSNIQTGESSIYREPAVVDPPPPSLGSDTRDLKDSAHRLNTIDTIAALADEVFAAPAGPASWSVNQQDLDQVDYRSGPEGSTAITKWYGDDENGNGQLRAEEAHLANGEVIDRWYHPNGRIQQILRQYDRNHSVSIYYYDTGEQEAMRIIKNGREIFTKYDRSGRLIQKTVN